MIFMDINYEEANIQLSPPKKFLESSFLQKLMEMTTNEGFVTFNLLTYDSATQDDVYKSISEVPSSNKYLIEGEEDVNKVIILTKGGKAGKGNQPAED